MSSILHDELKQNGEVLDEMCRKNAHMAFVLSTAIPTLKDLLDNVSTVQAWSIVTRLKQSLVTTRE